MPPAAALASSALVARPSRSALVASGAIARAIALSVPCFVYRTGLSGIAHPPIVIVSPSPETTPLMVAVSPSSEISTPGTGDGEGVGIWSPANTLSSE